MRALPELLQIPLFRRMYADDLLEVITDQRDRRRYHDRLASLPQTFCHMDTFRRNLFLPEGTQSKELVAVD